MDTETILRRGKKLLIEQPIWRHEILVAVTELLLENNTNVSVIVNILDVNFDCFAIEAVQILHQINAATADEIFDILVHSNITESNIAFAMTKKLGIFPSYVGSLLAEKFSRDTKHATGTALSPPNPVKEIRTILEQSRKE